MSYQGVVANMLQDPRILSLTSKKTVKMLNLMVLFSKKFFLQILSLNIVPETEVPKSYTTGETYNFLLYFGSLIL